MKSEPLTVYSVGHGRQSFFALFIFSSIFFFGFYADNSISKDVPATVAPTATPTPIYCPPPVIELEKTLLTPSRPNGISSGNSSDDGLVTRVLVTAVDPKGDALNYKYSVSGGRIVGEGAEVRWDLTGAQPGTYTITVDVTNKAGNERQTITKQITVMGYEDDGHKCLVCPEISVAAPNAPTEAGERMIFTANVTRGFEEGIVYKWTISSGEIIEGQRTPVIKVATNRKMAGKSVEATVVLEWDCSDICRNDTASASGLVTAKKRKEK